MTGLEAIAVLIAALTPMVTGVSLALVLVEREKQAFVARLARALPSGLSVEQTVSGDLHEPLALTIADRDTTRGVVRTRVTAVVRGDQHVWHVQREGAGIPVLLCAVLSVIERGWRPPNGEAMECVGELHPRLALHACDREAALAELPRLRAELTSLLSGQVRAFRIRPEHAFIELPRRGLSVAEVIAAVARLDMVLHRLGPTPTTGLVLQERGSDHGGHSPDGAPVGVPSFLTS